MLARACPPVSEDVGFPLSENPVAASPRTEALQGDAHSSPRPPQLHLVATGPITRVKFQHAPGVRNIYDAQGENSIYTGKDHANVYLQ